nr:MAG TPA: hypothetical protein [Caudoviricetes sp.]DAR86218.1 MAG TPA: hypothetical protein [Caudoviricetes sp.]
MKECNQNQTERGIIPLSIFFIKIGYDYIL